MASESPALAAEAGRRRFPERFRRTRTHAPPVAIWLPALLVASAAALPLVYLLFRSAGATDEAWSLLLRLRTAQILARSLLLAATVTAVSTAMAVPLAWLIVRTDIPSRRLWAVLTALPLVIPSYVGAFLLVSAIGPKGLLQSTLLAPLGIERLPSVYGLGGAALTLSLLSYPYILLTVRGALANLDPALEEAARSLGLGRMSVFLRVTLPQLRPAIASGGLLVSLYALSDFGAVSLLRYETFTWAIYQQYQNAFDRGVAAVLSLVLVGLAVMILVSEQRSRGGRKYHRASSGAARPMTLVRLGRWKWPALAFCVAVVTAALVVPIALLVYWLARGIVSGEPLLLLWAATRNSIYVSALTAIVAVGCSLPVAVLVARYPSAFSRFVERVSFTGYALPGVVVALSLVFFGINVAVPIYQTVWLLLLAYLVLFLPAAIGATRAAVLQVNPALEEAARGLGRAPLHAMLTVTAPLVRSGVFAGGTLVFLLTMKELPATLILSPLGFNTLATEIWSASSEAFFAQAAAPALTLVAISALVMVMLMLRDRRAWS